MDYEKCKDCRNLDFNKLNEFVCKEKLKPIKEIEVCIPASRIAEKYVVSEKFLTDVIFTIGAMQYLTEKEDKENLGQHLERLLRSFDKLMPRASVVGTKICFFVEDMMRKRHGDAKAEEIPQKRWKEIMANKKPDKLNWDY